MTVSPGNLDSLMNMTFPVADFTAVSVQSKTGVGLSPSGGFTYSTVTLNTTGFPGPGTMTGETLTIVGVNDSENSFTYSLALDGQFVGQVTDYVGGYSSGSLLIGIPVSTVAETSMSAMNGIVGVLSSTPIPAQTSITFASSGSSNITPAAMPSLGVLDTTTGQPIAATPQPYSGPVAGLTSEFITTTSDSLNVTVATPNWFVHTGSGNDAIAVSSGTNVLDGSTGSNFLTGGTGADTFFVDDRGATADIWSTVNNFHSGDSATIWGITPSDFKLTWLNGQGAAGYTGLTLGATAVGHPNATLTLAGFTSADLSNGRLTVSFGTTGATGGVPGSNYMLIKAT